MDLGTDGIVNTTRFGRDTSQARKNPLVANKGYVRPVPGVQRRTRPFAGAEPDSGLPTQRIHNVALIATIDKKLSNGTNVSSLGSMTMTEDAEECKITTPSLSMAEKTSPDWAKITLCQIEERPAGDSSSPPVLPPASPVNSRAEYYAALRASLDPHECVKRVFGSATPQLDVTGSTVDALPPYTAQAYRYRAEAFTPEVKAKCARSSGHPGITLPF